MKKILFSVLLLFVIGHLTSAKTKELKYEKNKDLEFTVSLSDTVARWGDQITLKLLFKNRTDAQLPFFPIAKTVLCKTLSIDAFGIDNTTILNAITDQSLSVWLAPGEVYGVNYLITVGEPAFQLGENKFSVYYSTPDIREGGVVWSLTSSELRLLVR